MEDVVVEEESQREDEIFVLDQDEDSHQYSMVPSHLYLVVLALLLVFLLPLLSNFLYLLNCFSHVNFFLILQYAIQNNIMLSTECLKYKKKMAFVFRNQINSQHPSSGPGPAHYKASTQEKQPRVASAPFNQSSPRKLWSQNKNPGPGDYSASTQKHVIATQISHKTFLIPENTEMSIFKSECSRFTDDKQHIPGPGKYIVDKKRIVREKSPPKQSSLQKYLKAVHEQKSADNGDLSFLVGQGEESSQELKREVLLKKKVEKKNVPFNYSVGRQDRTRPKTSLGPGSYNIQNTSITNRDDKGKSLTRKQASTSLSKFKKVIDNEKSKYQEELNLNILQNSQKKQHSKSAVFRKSANPKKEDFFGSTVSRFYRTHVMLTPGPGDYHISNPNPTLKVKKNSVCFGRSASKPPQNTYSSFTSPFGIRDLSIKRTTKQEKPKKGCFGSSQPRFKKIKDDSIEEDTDKDIHIGEVRAKEQKIQRKSPARYRVQQKVITKVEQQIDERPLCYAPESNTLQKKVGQKYQINAPFSTQAQRFNQPSRDTSTQQLQYQMQNNLPKNVDRKLPKRSKPKGFMESNQPRFDTKKENKLCPWSYDPKKVEKKEFNKLFK